MSKVKNPMALTLTAFSSLGDGGALSYHFGDSHRNPRNGCRDWKHLHALVHVMGLSGRHPKERILIRPFFGASYFYSPELFV
jgi:hypothetical protein